MGNFTDEIDPQEPPPAQVPAPPSTSTNAKKSLTSSEIRTQSDFASETFSGSRGGNKIPGKLPTTSLNNAGSNSHENQNNNGGPQPGLPPPPLSHPPLSPTTVISEEWSSTAIIFTAVISSFIAIILVLLLILTALLFRHKLLPRGKMLPPGSENGTLSQHYEPHHHHHHLEFGYVPPEDIRKAKVVQGDYQEPFADPQFSSFVAASNGMLSHTQGGNSSGNSNNGSSGKMAEYYSCTLVSNPLAQGNNPQGKWKKMLL
jgi:hypothetical protein